MYNRVEILKGIAAPVVEFASPAGMLVTCVPPNAKNRNEVGPTDSERMATKSVLL